MAVIGNPKYEERIKHHLAKYETKRSAVIWPAPCGVRMNSMRG